MQSVAEHRALPIESLVDRLTSELFAEEPQADDFTLLGLEVRSG